MSPIFLSETVVKLESALLVDFLFEYFPGASRAGSCRGTAPLLVSTTSVALWSGKQPKNKGVHPYEANIYGPVG